MLLATLAVLAFLAAPAISNAAYLPLIVAESVSNVSETNAVLEARIDSGQLETTEYQFRVAQAPCLASPATCPAPPGVSGGLYPALQPGVIPPVPGGRPDRLQEQLVSVDLNGAGLSLEPGREYHYAVIAVGSAGEPKSGPDQAFTTLGSAAPVLEAKTPDRRYAHCVARARKIFAATRRKANGTSEVRRAHRRKHRELARCRNRWSRAPVCAGPGLRHERGKSVAARDDRHRCSTP